MNSRIKKRSVEGCLRLDITIFTKSGVLERTPGTCGVLYLPQRENNALSLVSYELVQLSPGRLGLRVEYLHVSGSGKSALVDYVIELEATPCRFGGSRWWFLCPGGARQSECGVRCRTLYRPQEEPMLACRGCHGLSYRSQTRRDKVYLDYVRLRKKLERILDKIDHTRNGEKRKQLQAQAEVIEQRLDEFVKWAQELRQQIAFGHPVCAWQRRAVDRAYDVFWIIRKGSDETESLRYEVGSVLPPDRRLADRA